MALKYLIERDFDKKVKVISKDKLPKELYVFDFVKEIEFGKNVDDFNKDDFDLLITLDYGILKAFSIKGKTNIFTINIDHHVSNDFFGDLNYVKHSPSCCSILKDIFKELNFKFDKELSTRLLLGVYTDSGMFSHDDGTALKDAVFLIENNADYINGIVNPIKYNVPLDYKKYLSIAINNFKIVDFLGFKIGVSTISKSDVKDLDLDLADIRGAPNYLQEIGGIDFLFTLSEREENIKGSFRSRKDIDVLKFAKSLGGGGHKFAAAFVLEKMPLEKAEKKVFEAIKKVLDNKNT